MTRKKLLVVSLMAGFVLWAAPGLRPAALQAAELESITFAKEGPAVAVAVHIRGEFGNEAFTLREPERLVIDLSPVDAISAAEKAEINTSGVLRVRTGRFQVDVARIVFDLDGPGVMYRIDRMADGLKVTFWKEGTGALKTDERPPVPPAPAAPPKAETQKPAEAPPALVAAPATAPVVAPTAKPAATPAPVPVPAGGEHERGFFVLVGGGIGTFLSTESTFLRNFPINGKQGTAESTYTPKLNTPAVLSFGRYVRLQEMDIKLGLDIEYWNFKNDGAHVFTIPNPVIADADRTLGQTNSFRTYFTAVSAFGLIRIFTNGAFTVAVGPELGYVFGKYKFLDVIDIIDQAPYTEADVSIREITYADKTASSILAGVRGCFEYALSSKLSLTLDLKAVYASPEISELSNKIGLSQAGAVLGIQYSF
jgi:hypothetical protein